MDVKVQVSGEKATLSLSGRFDLDLTGFTLILAELDRRYGKFTGLSRYELQGPLDTASIFTVDNTNAMALAAIEDDKILL